MKQQNTKQKGLIGLAVMVVLAVAVIFGSEPLYRMLDANQSGAQAPGISSIKLNDGIYSAEEPNFDETGYKGMVTMEVKNGAVVSVNWDSVDKDGNSKQKLSMDGQYTMTEAGPKWHEQAKALADYVIANQSVDGITVGEDGKTDAVASVSIAVGGFVNLVRDCLTQAGGLAKPAVALKDGVYQAEEAEFDGSGYKGMVTLEVKHGYITSVAWDSVDKDGNTKRKLSMDGQYVMTETGPKWHEQADALANYVIANQAVDGITVGEDGKTDAVASVSIAVGGFVNLVNECLTQAQ